MIQKNHAVRVLVVGLGVLALSSGCATRGFVRGQMGQLRDEMGLKVDSARKDATAAQNTASEAKARADVAFEGSEEARQLALGKMGYHEVDLCSVYFAFDSDELSGEAQSVLDGVVQTLEDRPEVIVDIYGYADPTGSDRYNLILGERRAGSVLRYLAARTPGQLSRYAALSYGESDPSGSEPMTPEERTQARKVLVHLIERTSLTAGSAPTAEQFR